jgi:membrane associated rhomboid family serine protease
MFIVSYAWHGFFLNDIQRLTIPHNTFLTLFSVVYLLLGFILSFINRFLETKNNFAVKGLIRGVVAGVFVFLISYVFGISFNPSKEIQHVFLDFSWQVIEQSFGGFICGLVYGMYYRPIEVFS